MGNRLGRPAALLGALGVGALLPLSALQPALGAASSVPTFGNPTISGVQGTGFEQGATVDTGGSIYTSAPGSLSSTISYINRSFDDGQLFRWVAGAAQAFGKPLSCVGGGHSELGTDTAANTYVSE